MATIIQARWQKIQTLPLKHGSHEPDSEFCVMEAAAYVAGEPWSDNPKCVPFTIASFLRRWNDSLPSDADRDRLLKAFIPRIIGLPMGLKIEMRRTVMIGDWWLRTVIPELLRLAKFDNEADKIASHPECTTLAELAKAARATLADLADLATLADLAATLAALAALATRATLAARATRATLADLLEESESALVERMINVRSKNVLIRVVRRGGQPARKRSKHARRKNVSREVES